MPVYIKTEATRWSLKVRRFFGGEVASMTIRLEKDGSFSLWDLHVEPAHRRAGYARTLLNKAFKLAKHKHRCLWLRTEPENIAAITLYQNAGFKSYNLEKPNSFYPDSISHADGKAEFYWNPNEKEVI